MENIKPNLSPTEMAIMNVLWETGNWISIRDLIIHFKGEGKEWKRQTVNTFLTNMVKKGLVKKGGRKYMYAITPEEFESYKAVDVLDSQFSGSLTNFVSAVSGGRTLEPEEVAALKDYLEKNYPE